MARYVKVAASILWLPAFFAALVALAFRKPPATYIIHDSTGEPDEVLTGKDVAFELLLRSGYDARSLTN